MDDTLYIRVPAGLKEKLEEKAKEKGLNLSAYIRMLLSEEVKK